MYDNMSEEKLKHYAKTDRKGLPKKAAEAALIKAADILKKRAAKVQQVDQASKMLKNLGMGSRESVALLGGSTMVPLFLGTLGGYGAAKALAPSSENMENLRKEEMISRIDSATADTIRRMKNKQTR
jgi:hypothetical protein